MFCSYCGKEIKGTVAFCTECGRQLKAISRTTEQGQIVAPASLDNRIVFKKGRGKVILIFAIVAALVSFSLFVTGSYAVGFFAFLQCGLFTLSWLFGIGVIQSKKSTTSRSNLFFILGIIAFLPFFFSIILSGNPETPLNAQVDLVGERQIEEVSEEEKTFVVDCINLPYTEAVKLLSDQGFLSITSNVNSSINEDRWIVISQSIEGGTGVTSEDHIELVCGYKCILQLNVSSEYNLLFSKYDIVISIDDQELGKVTNGSKFSQQLEILNGEHKLHFSKEGSTSLVEEEIILIENDTEYSCRLSHGASEIAANNVNISLLNNYIAMGEEPEPSGEAIPENEISRGIPTEEPTESSTEIISKTEPKTITEDKESKKEASKIAAESSKKAASEASKKAASESAAEASKKAASESAAEASRKAASESAAEASKKAASESAAEASRKAASESAAEASRKAASESAAEASRKAASESAAEASRRAAEESRQAAEQASREVASREAEASTAAPKPVKVTSGLTFARNSYATISINGQPGATYGIEVMYKSGKSKAEGLYAKQADGNGDVSWTWKIGPNTTPGNYHVTITGNGEVIVLTITIV